MVNLPQLMIFHLVHTSGLINGLGPFAVKENKNNEIQKEGINLFACSLPNPANGYLDPIMSIDCSMHRRQLDNVEEPSSILAVSQKTNSRCSRYQPSRSIGVKTSTKSNHGREMERNVGFRASTSTAVNRIP